MPNFIKPVVKASDAQIAALLERLINRKSTPKPGPAQGVSGMPPELARGMLNQPPTQERVFGQLRDSQAPLGGTMQTLPIDEAMQKFMTDPERYIPGQTNAPPAKHIFQTTPGGPMDSSSMGAGIANETMKFKSVIPPGFGKSQAAILEGLNPSMTIRPAGVAPEPIPDKKSLTYLTMKLDDVWQTLGGGRSASAKLWDAYRKTARSGNKVSNAKDYFISNAIRYSTDPAKMSKFSPREARLLEQVYQSYKDETGEDLRLLISGGE